MMQEIIRIMLSSFQGNKEKGCYILFYLLALGLGLAVAWDRYGKTEIEDNWMVEEAKKQIHLWPFLYGLLATLLVVMNPLAILFFQKKTMIEVEYHKVWGLLLFLFLCAYGIVCFLSILREKKQQLIVIFGFVMLIGIAGSCYGIMGQRPGKQDYQAEQTVAEFIKEQSEQGLVVGNEAFLEYIGVFEPRLEVLYGKDMYTHPMDLGIMEGYPAEVVHVYELMKEPKRFIGEISRWAAMCQCDVIVTESFENAPDKAGAYYKELETDKYIVYIR